MVELKETKSGADIIFTPLNIPLCIDIIITSFFAMLAALWDYNKAYFKC